MTRRRREGPRWPAPPPPSPRQHLTAEGRPKRSFATEQAAREFTFQQPEAAGQQPYRCAQCDRFHLASSTP